MHCIGPPDGPVQGEGNGFPPSNPDTVFIGVLTHPTRAGPSQQREGHAALHHCADVTMATNLCKLCIALPNVKNLRGLLIYQLRCLTIELPLAILTVMQHS